MVILGIDPGITGALAWNGASGWDVRDMPVTAKSAGSGQQVCAHTLADWLRDYRPDYVVLEQQQAMPKQGVTSVFSLGRTIGVIEGVLAAQCIGYTLVRPADWKKAAGLLKADKDRSRTLAVSRWPEQAALLARKKDHGRAEAMLLADFGRRCGMGGYRAEV